LQKEQIAQAFARHFHHFGYRKTSVDEVARELGISKKTIYASFSSKEEIFEYAVQQAAGQMLRDFAPNIEAQTDYSERLTRLVHVIFEQAQRFAQERDPFDFRYEIAEKAFRQAYLGFLQNLLERGMQAGDFAPGSPELRAQLADGLISTGIKLAIDGNAQAEAEVVQALQRMIR
jgi:AcrR family transcriptional regulator